MGPILHSFLIHIKAFFNLPLAAIIHTGGPYAAYVELVRFVKLKKKGFFFIIYAQKLIVICFIARPGRYY